jgi:hypothetical protein
MSEDDALKIAKEILSSEIESKDQIDRLYSLERYIEDFKFGDLVEALFAICPPKLIQYL